MKNFFISDNKADRAWAEWIAWQLEEADYSTEIQAWDFRPASSVFGIGWQAYTHFSKPETPANALADQGGIAAGGDVTVAAQPGGAAFIQTGKGEIVITSI